MEDVQQLLKSLWLTDVTKTTHKKLYPALLPTRPELRQAGKTILVTGGATGVGYGIAQAFVRASADTVIIIGRRSDVLATACSDLEQETKASGSHTKIITRSLDILNLADVAAFWKDLVNQGITVDVLVSNAAKFTEPSPILELGADEVWSQVEVNAKAPLYFTEKFYSQANDKPKFIVNVSTQAVHMTGHPGVAARPAYTLSKLTGTLLFQLIAQTVQPEKLQVVSFHPGLIYNDAWQQMGLPKDDNFDDVELAGAFAVWAATKQAAFLHGRFAWAAWDIEELSTGEIRKRIDEDPYYLRATIVGANGGGHA